jgi:hypothetical protein
MLSCRWLSVLSLERDQLPNSVEVKLASIAPQKSIPSEIGRNISRVSNLSRTKQPRTWFDDARDASHSLTKCLRKSSLIKSLVRQRTSAATAQDGFLMMSHCLELQPRTFLASNVRTAVYPD